jgi:hypothetical protein
MTEFAQEVRHYCRNPRCRMKLPEPVVNSREQFCCRGCYQGFYRFRCLLCEEPMQRKTERRQVCSKVKCRSGISAVQRGLATAPSLGRWSTLKSPENRALAKAAARDRGVEWAIRVNSARIIGPRRVLDRECA